ncbi:unnamed protein product [Schistosoma mattheei]|uniref:Uncharacterized protein n=1 Tax=Schistosoma mattheei TaxID=31246 RepID=A0A183PBS0_9TREM|nr:unnamed protein product [Schistosoma mattheei]
MVVVGSQQKTLYIGFRSIWHSSARYTCNIEETNAPWLIRPRVNEFHSQRRYH